MKTVCSVLPWEREAPQARVFRRVSKWSKSNDTTESGWHQLPLKWDSCSAGASVREMLAPSIASRVMISGMTHLPRIVLASFLLVAAAQACNFHTEPAALTQLYRSQGWKLPEISGAVSPPIRFEESYPKYWQGPTAPIPGLTARVIHHESSEGKPNVFEIRRQEYEQEGKHRVMSSQYAEFDRWIYRYDVDGKVVAYTFRLTPVEGHWIKGKWITDDMAACDFNATFVDDKGDGVFRILVSGGLTPDLVPQWALDRRQIPN
jgi:hypothetical protein